MLFPPGVGQGLVHDADGDLDAGGDGADGFPALAAGEDGGALVIVDAGRRSGPGAGPPRGRPWSCGRCRGAGPRPGREPGRGSATARTDSSAMAVASVVPGAPAAPYRFSMETVDGSEVARAKGSFASGLIPSTDGTPGSCGNCALSSDASWASSRRHRSPVSESSSASTCRSHA